MLAVEKSEHISPPVEVFFSPKHTTATLPRDRTHYTPGTKSFEESYLHEPRSKMNPYSFGFTSDGQYYRTTGTGNPYYEDYIRIVRSRASSGVPTPGNPNPSQGYGYYQPTGMWYRTTNGGTNINTSDYNRIVQSMGYPGVPGR